MVAIPDRINVDKKDRPLYEKVENANILEFKKKGRKEQFLFVMAIGFENKVRNSLSTRDGFFLTKDLRAQDEALINAIAVHESNSTEILSDKEKVFGIAEEYAHAGIKLLVDKIETPGFSSFHKHFENELHEIYDRLFSNKDNGKDIIS